MTPESFRQLQAWLFAIQEGLVGENQWRRWADARIQAAETPDLWVIELATAQTPEQANSELVKARRSAEHEHASHWLDHYSIELGLLYHRHLSGELTAVAMLRQAGELADARNACDPACEHFFGLAGRARTDQMTGGAASEILRGLFEPRLRYLSSVLAAIGIELRS